MPSTYWLKPIAAGLLLAALTKTSGSVAVRPDPYGLVALGLAPGDGGPVEVPQQRPAGDAGEAVRAFEIGEHDRAAHYFVRAILRDPNDREARRALGALQLGLQDYEAALGQYKTLDRLAPDDPETLFQLAWAHHGLGQAAEALACAQEVVRQRPFWAAAAVRLGQILLAAGDRAGGTAELRRAATCPSVTPEALFDVGNHFLENGEPREAIPFFERALALRPDYSWAANNLGNAYKALEDPIKATVHYRQAIEADPDNPNPHNGLGVLREARGDLVGALEAYREAGRIDPEYMDAHYNAGVVLLKLGRAREAIAELDRARKLRPDFAATWFQLSEALYKLGQVDEAKASWRRATSLDPAVKRMGGAVYRLLGERHQ